MSETFDPSAGVSAEQATAAPAVPAATSPYVNMEKSTFHFKTDYARDENGEFIFETDASGKKVKKIDTSVNKDGKHPSVDLYLPVPKISRLQEFLIPAADPNNDPFKPERDLILACVSDQIYRVARAQIGEFRERDLAQLVTAAALNYDKLDFSAIARMPKSERGAFVPDEASIKAFLDKYLEVMPGATNKDKKKIENHVVCFNAGFKKQRGNKEFLEVFQNMLAIFVQSVSENDLEEHAEVIEYFSNKLKKLMGAQEKITLDDI